MPMRDWIPFLGSKKKPGGEVNPLPGDQRPNTTKTGRTPTPEQQMKYQYAWEFVDPSVRAAILDIRQMDRDDPRVKKIHQRTARSIVKGGLVLDIASDKKRIINEWKKFVKRLNLDRQEKLESDARGLIMEGNLPIQWIIDKLSPRVVSGVRMPAETIRPVVGENGVFLDPKAAYEQIDMIYGRATASFALWQLTMGRLSPDNYDDWGCHGRPLLDSCRQKYLQLVMTEKDMVKRRHVRANQRLAHSLEGATEEDLEAYEAKVYNEQGEQTTDFFSNKKTTVQSIQGDANLDQIADVVHLINSFLSGSPMPAGLLGYTEGLNRDILDDLKKDFFEEVDALQDTHAWVYQQGFDLHLLLQGINPEHYDYVVKFAERKTDSPNQRADLALKYQALGLPQETVWRTANQDPAKVLEQRKAEQKHKDVYGVDDEDDLDKPRPRVSVTPGNARKGESATSISNN